METLDQFVADRSPAWSELDLLVRRAGHRPARLGARDVRRLGAGYRAASADLARARRCFSGDPVVRRLEQLVADARTAVYDAPATPTSLRAFVARGYWRRVRERPGFVLLAALCFLGPALLALWWAHQDPGAASGLVPSEFRYVTEPRTRGGDWGLALDEQAAFASQLFTNNIRVAMLAFAGGLLLGVGALAVLMYNGLVLGAVFGLAIGAGNGPALGQQVFAHGVLELSCVVLAGAAGLRMGWAIVDPGARTRGAALRTEARAAVEVLLGTAAWLVVAGLVEGFVTPRGWPLGAVAAVGIALGVALWTGVLVLGRPLPPEPASVDVLWRRQVTPVRSVVATPAGPTRSGVS